MPVYALLIGAFIPQRAVGVLNLRGLVLFARYLAGVAAALGVKKKEVDVGKWKEAFASVAPDGYDCEISRTPGLR